MTVDPMETIRLLYGAMSSRDLDELRRLGRQNPRFEWTASADEIREGLAGNLCRCTGYHNIVRAVQAVVWQMAHTTEMPALVPGDVIPPESLPGGILSSPTGAEIKVPGSKPR